MCRVIALFVLVGCVDALPEIPAPHHQRCWAETICDGDPVLLTRASGCAEDAYDLAAMVGESCNDRAHVTCGDRQAVCIVRCEAPGYVPCL